MVCQPMPARHDCRNEHTGPQKLGLIHSVKKICQFLCVRFDLIDQEGKGMLAEFSASCWSYEQEEHIR
jgi:hypothetical protein